MSTPDNPPAFPAAAIEMSIGTIDREGMSLRDWFAGQALGQLGITISNWDGPRDGEGIRDLASYAYSIADAMLSARSRTPSHTGE